MKNLKKFAALTAAMAMTVSAMSSLAVSAQEEWISDSTSEAPFSAWITMSAAGRWYGDPDDADATDTDMSYTAPVSFTDDGTYTATTTFIDGTDSLSLLILSTNINGYAFTTGDILTDTPIALTIDSVTLTHADGTTYDIAYNPTSDGAFATENDGTSYRMNLLNTWGNKVEDISDDISASPVEAGDTISITFEISGLNESDFNVAPTLGDVDADGSITISDALAALQEYSNLAAGKESSFDVNQNFSADVNSNDKIDIDDALRILQYYSANAAGLKPTAEDYFVVAAE